VKSSFYLLRVRGIPIGLNYSWFAIFLLITATLAYYVFPELYPEWSLAGYWGIGLGTSLLFFASLLAHELAHSLVAQAKGIQVKDITLFIFGGAARISREASMPRTEMLMALAGPLASLVLAGLFALVWVLLEGVLEPLAAMAYYLCLINALLAAFNILPGFPLDGGRVLRSVIWWRTGDYRKATGIATRTGQAFSLALIVSGLPVGILYYWFNGLWLMFIGAFLWIAATKIRRQTTLRDRLRGLSARDLMIDDCPLVSRQSSVREIVDDYAPQSGHRCLLVGDAAGIEGVILYEDIKRVPRRLWSGMEAREAMTPLDRITTVGANDGALSVLERMAETNSDVVLVASGGTVVGAIERRRVWGLGGTRGTVGE
jgi:Zn-dependent protease/CBS domain-containing protein